MIVAIVQPSKLNDVKEALDGQAIDVTFRAKYHHS